MLDLRKYRTPVKKVVFDFGEFYLRRLSVAERAACDDLEGVKRPAEIVRLSLCDEAGQPCDYTIEDMMKLEDPIVTALYIEAMEFGTPPKKKDLAKKS